MEQVWNQTVRSVIGLAKCYSLNRSLWHLTTNPRHFI